MIFPEQPEPPEDFEIDPGLGAAAKSVPAASREDSRHQAILKLHHPSGLDYKAYYGLQGLLKLTHKSLVESLLLIF